MNATIVNVIVNVVRNNMPRPKKPRRTRCCIRCDCFYPKGLKNQEVVTLNTDEIEALKLHDVDGHDQTVSAGKMKISQSTFARILDSARRKIASALIGGKEIKLN